MNTAAPSVAPSVNGQVVALRPIPAAALAVIVDHPYSVSITEPHSELARLQELHTATGFWSELAGALAIVEPASERLLGTIQFYRSAPCIHGIEIGYLIHSESDRGKGYASAALQLFSDQLFLQRPQFYRHQLLIEVWNTPSWKVAERCGFVREGVLRSCGFGDGDPADCFVYSRTAKDVRQQRASANG